MYRDAINMLIRWKLGKERKPLILLGARQVGKTWLIKEFGNAEYKQTVYVNFEEETKLQDLFLSDFNISRIITALQAFVGFVIEPAETLIVFDEIQSAPKGITSLKYFCENAPQYHVIASDSLLGMALHQKVSFPVGKVDFLHLYPMSFHEFLLAMGETGLLAQCYCVKKPALPLIAYQELSAFKLYHNDIGLLGAMSKLSSKTVIDGSAVFTEYKGALTEQFVFQQLRLNEDLSLNYFAPDTYSMEIDFIVQNENGDIIPIEVKAGENLRAKSFKLFCEKFKPQIAIRTSLSDFRQEEWMTNVPLYIIGNYFNESQR